MTGHHFISYSPSDGQNFAIQLCDVLTVGPPSYSVWLDKRDMRPGSAWDEQIVGAIRTAESLLFVMTRDSVDNQSVCKQEWIRALKYKILIVPLLVHKNLVGEAFSRLDPAAEKVMQALAVYARPVTPAAVDYLLQPHLPGVNSAPIANRLVNMHFARREAGRYYLHPVDRAYAFARIPEGEESNRLAEDSPPYTQFALLHRGAEYFKQTRKPREDWKTIEDLAPQLAEFDLRCDGQDYDAAAAVLRDIDFDCLLLWGHHRLMVELHERLQGKLSDPQLKGDSVTSLGSAYNRMGQLRKAIACHEQALDNAREIKDRQAEGAPLANLGTCYADLGQTARAMEYYEQSLVIARDIRGRDVESGNLANKGDVLVDQGEWNKAVELYNQAIHIADEIGNAQFQNAARIGLGLVYLNTGDLPAARAAAETARQYDMPKANHNVLALLGVILLRQGDFPAAPEVFAAAVAQADALLTHTAHDYNALDTKGLALCGLVLCGEGEHLTAAVEAFQAARAINRDPGIVQRVLRLLDTLALADAAGILAQVRTAAAGE